MERPLPLLLLAGLLPALAGAPAWAGGPLDCAVPGLDDRCEQWAVTYNHPGNQSPGDGTDELTDLALSPDGARIYVTGRSVDEAGQNLDIATAAFDAATGAQLWASRYASPGGAWDAGYAVQPSPDGERVFVSGITDFATNKGDYVTIAYDADTGSRLWLSTYDGPGGKTDASYELAVSPDGRTVFTPGVSWGSDALQYDYGLVAYDAASGEELWTFRYGDEGFDWEFNTAISISPDGSMVYLTGLAWVTVAVHARDDEERGIHAGDVAWVNRFNGWFVALDMDIAPDGGTLYASGSGDDSYGVIAYDALTGTVRWSASHHGDGSGFHDGAALALSPDGARLFVTGTLPSAGTDAVGRDIGTVAFDALTGQRRWAEQHDHAGYGLENGNDIGVSPDGRTVYVTGLSAARLTVAGDIETIAYDAASGTRRWIARYNGGVAGSDGDAGYVVAPLQDRVIVGATLGHNADPQQPNFTQGGNYHDYGILSYAP